MKENLIDIILPPGGALAHGQVALAHEAAFNAAFLSEGSPAMPWASPARPIWSRAGQLAPAVTVADLFEYRVESSAEAFLTRDGRLGRARRGRGVQDRGASPAPR
jgi:hypothetical protein